MKIYMQQRNLIDWRCILQAKREGFLSDYSNGRKPVWIWQFQLLEEKVFDIEDRNLHGALIQGAGGLSRYWLRCGFESRSRPHYVFDGLATGSREYDCGYMLEIHADGHLILGYWDFFSPDGDNDGKYGMSETHSDLSIDAAAAAVGIFHSLGYSGSLLATSALINADCLAFTAGRVVLVSAPRRSIFNWPIVELSAVDEIEGVGKAFAAQFMRIYGSRKYFS